MKSKMIRIGWISLLMLLIFSQSVTAAVLFLEGFENYATGVFPGNVNSFPVNGLPGGWQQLKAVPQNNETVSNTYYDVGNKSFKLISINSTNNLVVYHPLNVHSSINVSLEVSVRMPSDYYLSATNGYVDLFNPALGTDGIGFGRVSFRGGIFYAAQKHGDSTQEAAILIG
jgi:hypothetical protein